MVKRNDKEHVDIIHFRYSMSTLMPIEFLSQV